MTEQEASHPLRARQATILALGAYAARALVLAAALGAIGGTAAAAGRGHVSV
jgi:hypothetical protein